MSETQSPRHTPCHKPTVLVKASGITTTFGRRYISGVGRSTQQLLTALDRLPEPLPFRLAIYVNGIGSLDCDFHDWRFACHRFPLPAAWGNERTAIEPWLRKHLARPDLLHIPHNADRVLPGERYIVTMHDVFEYEAALSSGDTARARQWEAMAAGAEGIMTCSMYSRDRIAERLRVDERKISVVYWGTTDNIFFPMPEAETEAGLTRLGLRRPYFLAVSCAAERKNIATLLRAFRLFLTVHPRHSLILVWASMPDALRLEYLPELAAGSVVALGHVTDAELRTLYNGASCTLFPTRAEGFGFPILESFACGTPVMTCRNTSLTEVGGDAAIYVGEDDTSAMVDVMRLFERGLYDTAAFRHRAEAVTRQFSWERTAREYVKFYSRHLP